MKPFVKLIAVSLLVSASVALTACNKNVSSSTPNTTTTDSVATAQTSSSPVVVQGIPQGVKLASQQELHLLEHSAVPNTDISTIDTSEASRIYQNVFEPLVRKARDGSYIPAAAQAYEVSSDGLTWTFHLRPDAKWQDDKPVTARDFVYSWQRLISSKNDTTSNYLVQMGVVNAQEIVDGKLTLTELGVTAVDDYTLQVQLVHPLPWLPTMVSIINLVPLREDLIAQDRQGWFVAGKVVGNGAYKFVSNTSSRLVFEKAASYWNHDNVVMPQVNVDVVQKDEARLSRVLEGLADIYTTPLELEQPNSESNFKVAREDIATEQYLVFNLQRVPDVEIRKALALLIPDQTQGFPLYYKFAPANLQDAQQIKEYSWSTTAYAERVKQALAILTQHGYSATNPLVLTYIVPEANHRHVQLMDAIVRNTNQVVKLEPHLVRVDQDYDVMKSNGDLILQSWHADYDHVSNFANLFTCAQHDITEYCNQNYDNLVAQAATQSDAQKRQALYAQASDIINNDIPVIYLVSVQNSFLINPQLDGYTEANIRYINFQDLYLKVK